jgi:hypothetical protein
MGIFDSIKNAIFGHAAAAPAAAPAAAAPSAALAPAPAAPAAPAPVDVTAMLTAKNAQSAQKLNWQTSIVDLMKLVGLDPSLANRKQLAQELGYKGDTNDSASMNIWLHQEVMKKLAESGGAVPASLRS